MTEEALPQLTELASRLAEAKAAEELAKSRRIAVEEQIAALIPGPDKGQKTVMLDGMKITVERGLNYKALLSEVELVCIAFETPPPIRTKSTCELDVTGYEWYRDNRPDVFAAIAQHVSVTPKKVSVTLKPAKET